MSRVVCWFSCGAASAVATKLALDKYGPERVVIAYCDTRSEHPDNERFMADCESWFGKEILRLTSDKYRDIWDVFRKTRYLVGPKGARCTIELKKVLRHQFEEPGDIQVFGYDPSERSRADRFRRNNPELILETPLIDHDVSKAACFDIIRRAGIELPMMYRLGYKNNNCIGCVKGGAGYWNAIRRDFPEVFDRMAKVERELGAAMNKSYAGGKGRRRVFLDELDPNAGRGISRQMSCDFLCGAETDEEAA